MTGCPPDDERAVRALAVVPGGWSVRATLRDGTPVLLRQIRSEDRDELAAGLRRLTPASRYLRFHADVDDLTEEQLDYLTQVDHVEHEAIVAVEDRTDRVHGIGVARYIRDPFDRSVAEAAVTVADEDQGRGAGTLLLGALAGRAREHGIEVFRNYVLGRNHAMLEVFDELGATREQEAAGLWRVDLPIPTRDDDLPDSPAGRAFRAAARDGLHLSSLLPPVWWRLGPASRGPASPDEDDPTDAALEAEELDAWLADRERRAPAWPTAPDHDPPA